MARRILAAIVPALVATALCVWAVASSGDRLPSELATHWNWRGEADGFSSLRSFVITSVAMAGVFWVLATAASIGLGSALRQLSGLATGAPGAVAGFFSTLIVLTVVANRDTAGIDADLAPVAANLPMLGLIVGGIFGAVLAGPAVGREPVRSVRPGEVVSLTVTWSGVWWVVGLLTIVGVVVALAVRVLVPLLLVPLLVAFARYHFTLGPGGIAISGGIAGWPSLRIPLEEISGAEPVEVRPFRQWGGWGLRLRLDGSQGLVTRSGPGVSFDLRDGKLLVVTVDDPETVVATTRRLLSEVES